jgi:MFS family permease
MAADLVLDQLRQGGDGGRVIRFLIPYRRLFTPPGALAFTLAGFAGRLPVSMLSVSTVVLVATVRHSYALAGAVSATGVAVTAVVSPVLGRWVDRYGQARVAVPAAFVFAAGAIAMLLFVHYGAPDWALFVTCAGSSGVPSVGAMARARWAELHPNSPQSRHTANSFEQVVDEVCFMLGPVLAMLLCTFAFPEAGLLTATVLLVGGTLLFAAQRATEPQVRPCEQARGIAPLRAPGLGVVLTTFVATGALFGSMEVATVAAVDRLGSTSASSAVLALQAAGSCLAGLVFGAVRLRGAVANRFVAGVAGMAAAVVPLTAAGSLRALAVLLFFAGMATAPTMATGMTLVQELIPPARLNEGMTTVYTGLLIGISAGAAAGGWTVDHLDASAAPSAYATPVAAGALALLAAVAGRRRLVTAVGRGPAMVVPGGMGN